MTGHVFIYGEIGKGVGQVSVNTVKNQLSPEYTDYITHIISPGGDVFEGFGIYNIIKNTGKPVVTYIEGQTASIATLIAFAGDTIKMNKTSEFMIHNPYISDLKGDARDLRNVAGQLDKIKSLLMDVSAQRATRNGKSITMDKLSQLYDNETWLTSDEAMEIGFVDEVLPALKAVARVDLNRIKMEKNDGWLKGVLKNIFKFKNEYQETLEDGRVVIVVSEDGNWTGKQVVTQEGEPLEAGEYKLASGKVIVVGEGSTIAEVKEAETAETENKEDMSKIKELEEKLAAMQTEKSAVEAKLAEATQSAQAQQQATAKLEARFEAKFKALEEKEKKEEEEKKKTAGTRPVFNRGPVNASPDANDKFDPMGEEALQFLRTRNLVN
jgi:ATP-dependent Clp protease protease subunit